MQKDLTPNNLCFLRVCADRKKSVFEFAVHTVEKWRQTLSLRPHPYKAFVSLCLRRYFYRAHKFRQSVFTEGSGDFKNPTDFFLIKGQSSIIRLICGTLFLCLLATAPFSNVEAKTEFKGSIASDRFQVVDGDSLKIRALKLRLQGIDAVEYKQSCTLKGSSAPCGRMATEALQTKIYDAEVRCDLDGVDHYGRALATCFIGDENLNAWLVKSGWAIAYRKYSMAYVEQENFAKANHRGIWMMDFVEPSKWRKGKY